jgi:hypothetical protein
MKFGIASFIFFNVMLIQLFDVMIIKIFRHWNIFKDFTKNLFPLGTKLCTQNYYQLLALPEIFHQNKTN